MSGLNCKPGDLARIVGMHPSLAEANDRIVKLQQLPPVVTDGLPSWRLTERVELVMVGNGRRGHTSFWIGESVWFDEIPDKYLRPIRGTDGDDETLAWAGKPGTESTEDRAPVEVELVGV